MKDGIKKIFIEWTLQYFPLVNWLPRLFYQGVIIIIFVIIIIIIIIRENRSGIMVITLVIVSVI